MMKLFLCLLIAPLSAANFAFVQQTPGNTLSQAFPAANTAGNIIVVSAYTIFAANPTAVNDTQGNTYTKVQGQLSGDPIVMFWAPSIKAGLNTVTVTGGSGMTAIEYSSANHSYYACPGVPGYGSLASVGTCSTCTVSTPINFVSTEEVLVIFAGTVSVVPDYWTTSSGTIRYYGSNVGGGGITGGVMMGDDDQPSISSYGVSLQCPRFGSDGSRDGMFLSLTSAAGCTSHSGATTNANKFIF